jgi:hypothetical protein
MTSPGTSPAEGGPQPSTPAGDQVDLLCQEVIGCMSRIDADYEALRAALERLQASIRQRKEATPSGLALFAVPIAAPDRVDELLAAELPGVVQGQAGAALDAILAREFGLSRSPEGARLDEPAVRSEDAAPVLRVAAPDRVDQLLRAEFSESGAPDPEPPNSVRPRVAPGATEPLSPASAARVDARLDLLLRSLISREFRPETAVPEWYAKLSGR